ncbi:MAG: DUF5686 and carboxypeptidase regulatory-like domain-containing protein [Prevotella sp.]|jgi:hypothetical protein|nr:DUF5686 and carboxypeptidase regulatory-like domain-containing protein [Prevotella sp.]
MRISTVITFLFISLSFYAQNFKGRITDWRGEALYGSTVYIKEINQGLICNEDGYYQTTLGSGQYTIEYKCLGYKSVEKIVNIPKEKAYNLDIILEENPVTLKEVAVSAKEDPAYPIMRKAIEKAPLYAGAVKEYKADVYIKVNAELLKISSFMDKMAKREEGVKLSDFKEQVFLQESYNEIRFTAPDKYDQTVKAFSSSIPDNMDSNDAMGIINSSFYMPKVGMYISPLNPKAFSYYKFRYEGFIEEEGLYINKIKVEPKLKDPILFEGYIYIAEGTWHIYSSELKTNAYGVRQDYTISYQKLGENIYLPITYRIEGGINLLGIGATLNYFTSLTYTDIEENTEIINEIAQKKSKKREFEIQAWDSLYTTKSDSLAAKRDSAYWAKVRVVPLDGREIISYQRKDSVQQFLDSARRDHHNSKFSFGDLLNGGKIGGDSAKITFRYNGLIQGGLHEYNFVDGLWMGQSFNIETKINKHNKLEISPYLYYISARKRLVGGGDINLSYAPMRLGKLNISAGSISEDYNPNGIYRLNNFSSSLIRGKNYNFFYQKDYVSVTNNIDLFNGFALITGFEIARRSGLANHTDYTWGKKSNISPNIFPDDKFNRTLYGVGFNYTPYAYYIVRDGAKRYVKYTSPTFYGRYSQGFFSKEGRDYQYYKLYGGIRQRIKISEFTDFDYTLEGGGFFGNNDQIHFADFEHFNTSNITVNLKSPFHSFMLLDNYAASTNKYWIRTNLNYESKYILLKRLPFLQGKMFSESLHLKNLYTPEMKLYTEAGYSVNLTRLVNIGVFASFKKEKYSDFGFRFLFDWENITRMLE